MKSKILLVTMGMFLLACGQVNAGQGKPGCNAFKVNIVNSVGSDKCILINKQIIFGDIWSNAHVPEELTQLSAAHFEMSRSDEGDATVILTYQCGTEQEITFLSNGPIMQHFRDKAARGVILNSKNMTAKYTIEWPSCGILEGRPATISWTLMP